MQNQTVVPPGGNFPIPATSATPLLAFRCAPAIKPYLAEDASTPAGILLDTPITFTQINGAVPITLPSGSSHSGELVVTVTVDGQNLAHGTVPLNASKVELPFSLSSLKPRKEPYDISCSATYSDASASSSNNDAAANQKFTATASLSFLPNPTSGSVTKMDLRTGALLAKPADGKGGDYDTVFPIGFYTSFDGYLSTNLSVINELKDQG